jgi:hypothetical protein
MVLLRLRYEAECLTSQHTKQNLRDQPPTYTDRSYPYRERFSPSTLNGLWSLSALRRRIPMIPLSNNWPITECELARLGRLWVGRSVRVRDLMWSRRAKRTPKATSQNYSCRY